MKRPSQTPKWLHAYAFFTACVTFFLIVAGGMVTSTDSGLAVPDWPLSYGQWFPPMEGGIFYEHGHRMIAGFTGILILLLNIFLWRFEPRPWVRRIGLVMLGGVIVQALLGGLTVLLLLPPQISIAHAMLGQTIFCLTVAMTHATGQGWHADGVAAQTTVPEAFRRVGMALPVLVGSQLFLGAFYRHTETGLIAHIIGAVAVFIGVCLQTGFVFRFGRHFQSLVNMTARLLVLICVQIGLGLVAWMKPEWSVMVTAHVGCGALILAQSVLSGWTAARCEPAASATAPAAA